MGSTSLKPTNANRQFGAIIVTFSLMLLFLIGFASIAIDIGRLFIVRTELQTALDSCALAAAQELDGQVSSITRARNAGLAAGNINNVNLQSTTWDSQPKLSADEVTFKDANYVVTSTAKDARYVQCQHTQAGVKAWLMPAMAIFGGNAWAGTNSVMGTAVATRGHAQDACPVPVGILTRNSTPPDYGFLVGEWIVVRTASAPGSGEMGWYNLDGSRSASNTEQEMQERGLCGIQVGSLVGSLLGTPGAQSSIDAIWNTRFGIYKANDKAPGTANYDGPAVNHPDLTGYAYTSTNWKNPKPQNAYDGIPAVGSAPSAENFVTKRSKFASFDNTGTSLTDGSLIVFGKSNALNKFKDPVASPGSTGQHASYGYNRRLVVVPVLTPGNNKVIDFACMLMLAPLTGPQDDTYMEYRGNAGSATSPCTTAGLAGGTSGPLVPVLVR